jgi:hypothetical protein
MQVLNGRAMALHFIGDLCSGRDAWARGNLQELGQLISASGRSSILNYECGELLKTHLSDGVLQSHGLTSASVQLLSVTQMASLRSLQGAKR